MKIGIISDIHSNIWALQSLFAHEKSARTWVCLGDCVGLLPQSDEVIELLKKHSVTCISGDHERTLSTGKLLAGSQSGFDVLSIQRESMTKDHVNWVTSLPTQKIMTMGKKKILLLHSLTGNEPSQKFQLDLPMLEKKFFNYDIVFSGHTHLPFLWEGKKTIFLNPGSLGFPVSVTRKGSYAILDTMNLHVAFRSINIPTRQVLQSLKKHAYPVKISEIVSSWV